MKASVGAFVSIDSNNSTDSVGSMDSIDSVDSVDSIDSKKYRFASVFKKFCLIR